MDSNVIPVVAIFFVFGAPITAWIVSRVLAHNEYMAMISRGITPPPDARAWRRAQREGWVPPPGAPTQPTGQWAPPPPPPFGYTGTPPMAPPNQYSDYYHVYAQRRLSKGIMVAMVGFALYLGLGFLDGHHGFGGPAIPGLIVMFVGMAQIISSVLAGATIGAPSTPVGGPTQGSRPGSFGPASAPQPPPPPPPAGAPPYGWRPGDVTQIEKPAGPPVLFLPR
jgi:hypothetical protein